MVDLERRQHYRDRNPPWIKLHAERLEDPAFAALPDNAKAHLLLIELLASRMGNVLPLDARFISARINARSRVDLPLLLEQGFLEIVASTAQAEREQAATPEGEGEESRGKSYSGASAPASPRIFAVLKERAAEVGLRTRRDGSLRLRCPLCSGDNVTVNVNAEGHALLCAHCGCPSEAVLTELGASMNDLYPRDSR